MLSRFVFDLLAAITLGVTAAIGAYAPVLLAKRDRLKGGTGRSFTFILGNLFSAGVMVSAGFCHLLGEALKQMPNMQFPLAPFLCGCGYLATLCADTFASSVSDLGHRHNSDAPLTLDLRETPVEVLAGLDLAEGLGTPKALLQRHNSREVHIAIQQQDDERNRLLGGGARLSSKAVTTTSSGLQRSGSAGAAVALALASKSISHSVGSDGGGAERGGAIGGPQSTILGAGANGTSNNNHLATIPLTHEEERDTNSGAGGISTRSMLNNNVHDDGAQDMNNGSAAAIGMTSTASLTTTGPAIHRTTAAARSNNNSNSTMAPFETEQLHRFAPGLANTPGYDASGHPTSNHRSGGGGNHHHHSHGHHHQLPGMRQVSFGTAVLMGIALCFHSLLEGAAMGAQSTISNSLHIFIAIVSHKGLAAYALGSSIVDSNVEMNSFWSVIIPFTLASPIGIFIGYIASGIAQGIGAASISALASGTFLYVAFMEVIPKELVDPSRAGLKLCALLLGFALMSILAIWA